MGEVGKWNHWDDSNAQKHRVGSAIFGKLALCNHQAIKYNAACLFGACDGAENSTLNAQLEYEFLV